MPVMRISGIYSGDSFLKQNGRSYCWIIVNKAVIPTPKRPIAILRIQTQVIASENFWSSFLVSMKDFMIVWEIPSERNPN